MRLSMFLFLMLKDAYDWDVSESDIAYDIKDPLFLIYGDHEKIVTHFIDIVKIVDPDFITKYYKSSDSVILEILKNKIMIEGASNEEMKVLSEKVELYMKEKLPRSATYERVDFSGSNV